MGGGHAVHERKAILLTTVVISHTFCMAKENELTPRGVWQQSRDPIMQISHLQHKTLISKAFSSGLVK